VAGRARFVRSGWQLDALVSPCEEPLNQIAGHGKRIRLESRSASCVNLGGSWPKRHLLVSFFVNVSSCEELRCCGPCLGPRFLPQDRQSLQTHVCSFLICHTEKAPANKQRTRGMENRNEKLPILRQSVAVLLGRRTQTRAGVSIICSNSALSRTATTWDKMLLTISDRRYRSRRSRPIASRRA